MPPFATGTTDAHHEFGPKKGATMRESCRWDKGAENDSNVFCFDDDDDDDGASDDEVGVEVEVGVEGPAEVAEVGR